MNTTVDWFSEHLPAWRQCGIYELADRPYVRILEIGSMEGLSARWMCDNLVKSAGHVVCVDPWLHGDKAHKHASEAEKRFDENTYTQVLDGRIRKFKSYSYEAVPELNGTFDLVYIDGDHEASSVIEDWVLVSRKVHKGSFVVFDDYGRNVRAARHQVKVAVDAILQMWDTQLELLHTGSQVIVRVR